MDEKTIKEALRKGERVTLECKRAKAEVPKSVWATYSAFANTIGGLILLGVNEDLQERNILKRYQIIGVDEPSKIITDFWNTLNSDKVNENILVDSDVEVVNMDGAAQVKAMIRDSNVDGNDSILIEYYGMDDIDPDSLRQYRTEFRQENSTHVWNRVDDKTFLRNLGGYTEDRQTGREGLTLAGLIRLILPVFLPNIVYRWWYVCSGIYILADSGSCLSCGSCLYLPCSP